jgi:hypothetical protein
MDLSVAAEIGAVLSGNGIAHGFGSREERVQGAEIFVCLPITNLIYPAHAAALDFHGSGQTFDLILGRSFLSNCELIVHGPDSRYVLRWLG